MIYALIFLAVLALVAIYTTYNLFRKNEFLESVVEDQITYMKNISSAIVDATTLIEQVDEKGTFKSDDEVGIFFDYLKSISSILSEYRLPENYGENKR